MLSDEFADDLLKPQTLTRLLPAVDYYQICHVSLPSVTLMASEVLSSPESLSENHEAMLPVRKKRILNKAARIRTFLIQFSRPESV